MTGRKKRERITDIIATYAKVVREERGGGEHRIGANMQAKNIFEAKNPPARTREPLSN